MGVISKLLGVMLVCVPALSHACWEAAGQRHNVSAELLYAVGKVESNLNPRAVNRSHIGRTGSYGIGIMQIESSNLRGLKKLGISERHLYDTCTNIDVGARILSEKIARHGLTWEAVGAYNASCTVLKGDACRRARNAYAWKVYRALYGLGATTRHQSKASGGGAAAHVRGSQSLASVVQESLS